MVIHTRVPVTDKYNSIRLHAEIWQRLLSSGSATSSRQQFDKARDAIIELYHYGSFDWKAHALSFSRNSVFVFHNVTPASELWRWSPLVALRALAAQLQLRLMPRSLPWIAVSEYNRKQLTRLKFRSVELVPLAFDLQEPGTKADRPTLLFVGRIAPSKNLIMLLRVFQSVCERSPIAPRLLLVSGRKKRCHFADAFQRELETSPVSGNVTWYAEPLPYSDLKEIYRSAWLYVSMSRHEGFGAPVCEAISLGTPALFLECGGTESMLGRSGCISRAEQDHFAGRVGELLSDGTLRQQLLAEQAAHVREFCREKVTQRLRAALKRLCERF